MAKTINKNKQSKAKQEGRFQVNYFLIGLMLSFITLIGFFQWGFLGTLYCNFFRLFVGENYPLVLLSLLVVGVWMTIYGRLFPLNWKRAAGWILVLSSLTTLSHFNQFFPLEPLGQDIFSYTFDIFKNEFLTGQQRLPLGGGMLGAVSYRLFGYLFGKWGTYILSAIMFFLGFFMLTNIRVSNLYQAIASVWQSLVDQIRNFTGRVSEISKENQMKQVNTETNPIEEHDQVDTYEIQAFKKPLFKKVSDFFNRTFYLDSDNIESPERDLDLNTSYQPSLDYEPQRHFDKYRQNDRPAQTAARVRKEKLDEIVLDLDYFDQMQSGTDNAQDKVSANNKALIIEPMPENQTPHDTIKDMDPITEGQHPLEEVDKQSTVVTNQQKQAGHWQDMANERQNLTDDQLEVQLKESEKSTVVQKDTKKQKDTHYQLPSKDLLTKRPPVDQSEEYERINQNIAKLEQTFASFGVDAQVVKANLGPAVTKYEIQPAIGVKVSKIVSLTDDIALALAARDIRMEAPIPGKSLIGIEVPNSQISPVSFSEIVDAALQSDNLLEVPLGRDVAGSISTADLSKMPHLLIAGSTGSGKSVGMNVIICSLLMKAYPEEVKFLMVDPKKVELTMYNDIPHLLAPVVTNPRKAAKALNQIVEEMEMRYEKFATMNVRNQESYNEQVDRINKEEGTAYEKMPKIVVFIDELADLMLVAGNEVENSIIRLAQMARAAGIHMIIATQRPSVDVITGIIKANIPSRLAFAVTSGTDSRTILDANGAEKLLGKGDMLFQPISMNKPIRVQGAYISDAEVERITNYIKEQRSSEYVEEMIISDEQINDSDVSEDEYFEDAVELIKDQETVSISQLQRKFRIGYNRAARLIDDLEALGYIGPADGSKPRQVYINDFT